MKQIRRTENAVERAILTAYDDHIKGTVANIQFDVESLAVVMKLTTRSAECYARAVELCDTQMIDWIKAASDAGGDLELFGRARAALSLQNKITAPRRKWRMDSDGTIEAA